MASHCSHRSSKCSVTVPCFASFFPSIHPTSCRPRRFYSLFSCKLTTARHSAFLLWSSILFLDRSLMGVMGMPHLLDLYDRKDTAIGQGLLSQVSNIHRWDISNIGVLGLLWVVVHWLYIVLEELLSQS